jgi:hypothetical protein
MAKRARRKPVAKITPYPPVVDLREVKNNDRIVVLPSPSLAGAVVMNVKDSPIGADRIVPIDKKRALSCTSLPRGIASSKSIVVYAHFVWTAIVKVVSHGKTNELCVGFFAGWSSSSTGRPKIAKNTKRRK